MMKLLVSALLLISTSALSNELTDDNKTVNLSIKSYEKSELSLEISEKANYDLFATGHPKAKLELLNNEGKSIASSMNGSIFNIELASGSYKLVHTAGKLKTKDDIDCKDLGNACEWFKNNFFHPEKLNISFAKTIELAAEMKAGMFKSLKFKGESNQFISLKIEKSGKYRIKTSLYSKADDTTIFLYNSVRPRPNMELIAKDRNSARSKRGNSTGDAMIIANLAKGEYLIKVIDAKNILRSSHLGYMISVSK